MSDIPISITQALDKFGLAQESTLSLLHRPCLIVTSSGAKFESATIGEITMIRNHVDIGELTFSVDSSLDVTFTTKGDDGWILCQVYPRGSRQNWLSGHFKLLNPSG